MPKTGEHLAIAKITDTFLGADEDSHGILTAMLTVDYGPGGNGWSSCAGGYNLGSKTTAFGMQFVRGILEAAGVGTWEQLKGRTILVIQRDEGGPILGIQNLPTEPGRRFVFAELAAEYTS